VPRWLNTELLFPTVQSILIFQHFSIILPFLDNFVCFFATGMIRGMLEPHLRKEANATQTEIGVTFFIQGGTYMISNPIAGMVV
jgi:hypothetical protein